MYLKLTRVLAATIAALAFMHQASAQVTRDAAIELTAVTSEMNPCITLNWWISDTVNTLKLWRRVKGQSNWGTSITLQATATSYADASAESGVCYEYSLQGTAKSQATGVTYNKFGSIVAGHNLPLVDARGNAIVLVDQTMAAALAPELEQLEQNLIADGWNVFRHNAPRSTLPATSTNGAARLSELNAIKNLIQADYSTEPTSNWALLLIGHLPVPYSGYLAPDGHSDHNGAWPTDGYYGTIGEGWTDISAMVANQTDDRTDNRSGDGKFDQSTLPAFAKLQVGRIDLSDMSSVPVNIDETTLLRQYLVRNHRFRRGISPYDIVQRRGLVRDYFGYLGGEAFASVGWRTGVAFFGRDQMMEGEWFKNLSVTPMLFAYACGGGWFTSMSGVASSDYNFGRSDSKAVFCETFGSYFGDWDYPNSILRAPLAGTAGSLGLTNIWSGRGYVHLHHMAMGETIGYGVRYSQNSTDATTTGDWFKNGGVFPITCNLMGDPTLRLHTVKPPSRVNADSNIAGVTLTWLPSSDATGGYHVYRSNSRSGPFRRLSGGLPTPGNPSGTPILSTSFTDATVSTGIQYVYLVKAVKLETSASGTYANTSVGELVTITHRASIPAPRTPTRLSALATVTGGHTLVWDDNANNEESYAVERKSIGSESWSVIASLPADSTSYVDSSTNGQIFHYRVRALTTSAASEYSNVAADYTLPGLVGFTSMWNVVEKSPGNIAVNTLRYTGSRGAAAVSYTVAPVVATPGDYLAGSGTLNWSHGDTALRPASVTLFSPSDAHLTRILKLTLSNPNGLSLGAPATTYVQIQDLAAQNLPMPWQSATLGTIVNAGYSEYYAGTFGLSARTGGLVASSTNDSLRFLHQSMSGDCQLTARILYLSTDLNGYSTAGVMIRGSLASNAPMVSSVISGANTLQYLYRSTSGGSSVSGAKVTATSTWVRLKKSGTAITGYRSTNGATWTQIGSPVTIGALSSNYYVGLAASSNTADYDDKRVYCRFDNVTFDSSVASPDNFVAKSGSRPGDIILSWSPVSGARSYQLERSTTPEGVFSIIASNLDGTNYTDANLGLSQNYYYRVKALNSSFESFYSPTAFAVPLLSESYEGWRYLFFGSTEDVGVASSMSDPDGDGVCNLLEYALSGNPFQPSVEILPAHHMAGGKLALTFTRSRNDLIYTVQGSSDLMTWINVAVNPGEIGQSVTVQDTIILNRRFLRLLVTVDTNSANAP